MTEEQFDKWITALESGEYKQCRQTIYDESRKAYCCLGVCSAVNGFTDQDGYPDYPELPVSTNDKCIEWNDEKGMSFPEIAALLKSRKGEIVVSH